MARQKIKHTMSRLNVDIFDYQKEGLINDAIEQGTDVAKVVRSKLKKFYTEDPQKRH